MKMKLVLGLMALVLICLPACSANSAVFSPTASTSIRLATQPALTLLQSPAATLTVLMVVSLADPFKELGQVFESSHPGTKVQFINTGMPEIGQVLSGGVQADVIASDLPGALDPMVQAGQVAKDGPSIFAENKLVVILAAGNPGGISSLQDLAKLGLKLSLASMDNALGIYTTSFLSLASTDPSFGPSFQLDVEKNRVAQADNSQEVVARVTSGEADAGICYVSDLNSDVAKQVITLQIPDSLNIIALYPIATVASSPHPDLAEAFKSLVLTGQGQSVMKKYGFIPTNP